MSAQCSWEMANRVSIDPTEITCNHLIGPRTDGWRTGIVHCTASTVTLTTMLAHALFGCCWHHLHEWEANWAAFEIRTHSALVDGTARDHEQAHPAASCEEHGRHSHHRRDHKPCEEARCLFVDSSSTRQPSCSGRPSRNMPPLCGSSAATGRSLRQTHDAAPFESLSAVPVRVQTQVWLL